MTAAVAVLCCAVLAASPVGGAPGMHWCHLGEQRCQTSVWVSLGWQLPGWRGCSRFQSSFLLGADSLSEAADATPKAGWIVASNVHKLIS